MDTGAIFSPCKKYRYFLHRDWGDPRYRLLFIMLNPSTADEVKNDPTVERCQVRAKNMGLGSVAVVNIFALRSTDPRALYKSEDPIGPENDAHILKAVSESAFVICAWGRHGGLKSRGAAVLKAIANYAPIYCLGQNSDGSPKHPLYLGYNVKPIPLIKAKECC